MPHEDRDRARKLAYEVDGRLDVTYREIDELAAHVNSALTLWDELAAVAGRPAPNARRILAERVCGRLGALRLSPDAVSADFPGDPEPYEILFDKED